MLPATPQISLAKEHCSYFGAYCKSGDSKEKSDTLDVSDNSQQKNGSRVYGDQSHAGSLSNSFLGSTSVSGLIKVSVEFTFYVCFIDLIVLLHRPSPAYMYFKFYNDESFS